MSLTSLTSRFPRVAGGLPAWAALREFFAYHGVWALGVRFLRRLSVRGKIGVVLGILLVALIPMSVNVVAERGATAERAQRNLATMRMEVANAALARAFRERLAAPANAPPSEGAAAAALQALGKAYEVAGGRVARASRLGA